MTPRRFIRTAALLAASTLALASAHAQPANTDWQDQVLIDLADTLEAAYIYEETGAAMAAFIRSDPDRYSAVTDKVEFAAQISRDLFEIADDRHLRVWVSPEQAEGETASNSQSVRPGNIYYCRNAPISHAMMAGNIGVIQVPRFSGDPEYLAGFDAAMTALDGAEAIILDMRDNCGGGPASVRHISTYFFDEPTHLVSTEFRFDDGPRERWTLDSVPGPRFADGPLLILTNGDTFSAGESFTFGMRVTGRARTVGENTGGGGHFGEQVRLSEDFVFFLPQGRTFDPRTGEGWEAEGLAPDIEATSSGAMRAALEELRAGSAG